MWCKENIASLGATKGLAAPQLPATMVNPIPLSQPKTNIPGWRWDRLLQEYPSSETNFWLLDV